MKIKIGDLVIFKKHKLKPDHPDWVAEVAIKGHRMMVLDAIPMKGFLVKTPHGKTRIFNGSELRKIEGV